MDISKYNKYYGYLLLLLSTYYFVSLVLNYDAAYKTWESWAYPTYSGETYAFLLLTYMLNIGVPISMLLVGLLLVKNIPVKWYTASLFMVFLVLDPFTGKVILLVGIGLWALGKYYAKNT